jgi:small subunit ribosomal protein S9
MADQQENTTENIPSKPLIEVAAKEAPTALPKGKDFIWGTGRRKSSVARVRIRPGKGDIIVNDKPFDVFFTTEKDRNAVVAPLQATEQTGAWDVFVKVSGGGMTGQAGAVELGLARALAKSDEDSEHILRKRGLMTRDPRMAERKKYGQPGARKRFQFSKR